MKMEGFRPLVLDCLLDLSRKQLNYTTVVADLTKSIKTYLEHFSDTVDEDDFVKCLELLCVLFERLMSGSEFEISIDKVKNQDVNYPEKCHNVTNDSVSASSSDVEKGLDLSMLVSENVVLPFLSNMLQGNISNRFLQKCWNGISLLAYQLSNDSRFVKDIVDIPYKLLKTNSTNSQLSHHDAYEHEESFRVMLCLELLTKVLTNMTKILPWYHKFETKLFGEVTRAMFLADEKVVGRLMSLLLPVMIGDNVTNSHVQILWETIKNCYEQYGYKSVTDSVTALSDRPIFLMCGVADVFFPPSGFTSAVISLLQGTDFWTILQTGFFHPSSLTRKRAMYLLKRLLDIVETENIELPQVLENQDQSIFWWTSSRKTEFSDMWMNYILLMETLEEKQAHVVRPLMPRFQLLVQAASKSLQNQSDSLLHTSWLLCLVQRASSHDNNHIKCWIVQQVLELNYNTCPILAQRQTQFLYGPLIKMLSVSSLYHRPQDTLLGQCPPIAESLGCFFNNILVTGDQQTKVEFFVGFLRGMLKQVWSGGPLVYVMRGLSQVTQTPIIQEELMSSVRYLLTAVMVMLEPIFRSATQYYAMILVMKLIDVEYVTVASFCVLLSCLRNGEAWKRGTHFHQKLVSFMTESTNRGTHWSKDNIQHHLVTAIDNYMKSGSSGNNSVEESSNIMYQQSTHLTRLLVLAYDSQLLSRDNSTHSHIQALLSPVISVLVTMNTHAYMPIHKACQAITLLTVILQETKTITPEDRSLQNEVEKIVQLCISDVLLFIQRQVNEITEMSALPKVDLYCDTLRTLTSVCWDKVSTVNHMTSLVQMCTAIAKNGVKDTKFSMILPLYVSLRILGTLSGALNDHDNYRHLPWAQQILLFGQQWNIIQQLPKPEDLQIKDSDSYVQLAWGKIASSFLSAQWVCLHVHLNHTPQTSSDERNDSAKLADCLASLDLTSSDDVIPVLKCMAYLIRQESEDTQAHAITVAWHKTLESVKDSCFWASYEAFLDIAFHNEILSENPDSPLGQCIAQLLEELFTIGEERCGIVYYVIRRLCIWARSSDQTIKHATSYIDTFIAGLMFGPVHSRGKRFINEVMQYLLHQKEFPGNQLLDSVHKIDATARTQVVSLLAGLKPDVQVHRDFSHAFLHELIAKYQDIMGMTTYRNYLNSLSHRHKHRLFMALVILQPVVDDSILPKLLNFLLEMLVQENQPSLRCMAEWLVILLVNRWSHLIDITWVELSKGCEKKAAYLCSLLTVVAHVGKLIQGKHNQVQYMDRAMKEILPWCMSNHFNIRVFSQTTMISLWNVCKKNQLEVVMSKYSIIECFINFTYNNRNTCKNTFKLLDNFFFNFHPLRDYSVETIVRTLPMLTCMTDEEWISPALFTKVDSDWSHGSYMLPLYNATEDFSKCQPGTWKIKYSAQKVHDDASENMTSGDVQKKMMPWRVMLLEAEIDANLQEDYGRKQHKTGGMVLVASLVDKIPNLGGLCRTAEIFGVSEFVIGNLAYVQDRGFQGLSVSAHKWIPIKEVVCHRLKTYLLGMKASGYTLVGAEQTAQSQCLTNYAFPKKTLLLLGNEKEGIPVDLIQLLDACVEIPQQGIIRSLNVHVSGALLVWEYTRQQLLNLS